MLHSAIINEDILYIRHSCGIEETAMRRQTQVSALMKLAFCQGRHKITKKNKEYILGSDKYWGGLEIMQGEKWRGNRWNKIGKIWTSDQ